MHRDCHASTPKKSYLREAEGRNVEKVLFCINELWTENMPKFESSQDHFVDKRFRVKKPSWNIYKSLPSDTRVLANIGTLYKKNFLKKVKCFNLEVSTKRNFSKELLFGQGVFSRKTIREETNKRLSPLPTNYYEWQRPTILLRVAESPSNWKNNLIYRSRQI